MHRRQFLGAFGAFGASIAADAFALEPRLVRVTRHDVPVRGLPPALDGTRIAQVSDLHLPACEAPARAALRQLERERPDIVVHTGDSIETAAGADALVELATGARGTLATVATLGNWECREGVVPAAERAWARAGVPLLVNAHLLVRVRGAALALVGLDDLLHGRPDPVAARSGLAEGTPEIWLAHEPALADRAPFDTPPPALLLAGHTHGGQLRLPGIPAFTPVGSGGYVAGWYRSGFAPLYVSRGIGTAEIRARLFCPPELPIFTLRTAPH